MAGSLAPAAAQGYTINGTAEGLEKGDTVFLCQMQGFFALEPLDTCVAGKKGTFAFKGQIDGCADRILYARHKGQEASTLWFLLEDAPFSVQMFSDEKRNVVVGGPSTELKREYEAGAKQYEDALAPYWKVCLDTTVAEKDKLKERLIVNTYSRQRDEYTKRFMLEHAGTPFGDYLLGATLRDFKEDEREMVLNYFGSQPRHYRSYKAIMAELAAEKATAEGAPYTDLAMPDPNGKTIRVSDYVGKNRYTLIDFWASWCGPCRAEMPTVVKAYTDYHAKGFEVVGVSLDNNKAAWLKAIGQLNMPWPQMSDLKGWQSEGAKLYNVKAIPANVLVDQQGKIIAKDLRGEDLLQKMAELLK